MWSRHVNARRASRAARVPLNPRLVQLAMALSRQSIHPGPLRRG